MTRRTVFAIAAVLVLICGAWKFMQVRQEIKAWSEIKAPTFSPAP